MTQGRQIAAQLGHAVDARHRETICWIWSRHQSCTCCRAESRVIASPKVLSKFRLGEMKFVLNGQKIELPLIRSFLDAFEPTSPHYRHLRISGE
jgi:hypothetical protein